MGFGRKNKKRNALPPSFLLRSRFPPHRKLSPTPRTRTLSPGEGPLLNPLRRVNLDILLLHAPRPIHAPVDPSVKEQQQVRPIFCFFCGLETHRQKKSAWICPQLAPPADPNTRMNGGRGYTSREALGSAMSCGGARPTSNPLSLSLPAAPQPYRVFTRQRSASLHPTLGPPSSHMR